MNFLVNIVNEIFMVSAKMSAFANSSSFYDSLSVAIKQVWQYFTYEFVT